MISFLRRRNWSTIAVILLIGILFVVALVTNRGESERAFDPESNGENGLLLLRTWLVEMGYDMHTASMSAFTLPTGQPALLLVYPGAHDFSQADADQLYEWVAAGNSVAVFLPQLADTEVQKRFGVGGQSGDYQPESVVQPLVADNLAVAEAQNGFGNLLDLEQDQAAVSVVATQEGQPVIVAQRIGAGTAWFFSDRYTFTNFQLSAQNLGAHFLPLLRTIPDGGIVQLDTYHLFGTFLGNQAEITSIQGWLYYTAWGNAILFAALAVALYLLLQGRRLGPPLPSQEQLRRREAAEFVVAMANLYRRGDVVKDVAAYQKQRLKQALGRPLHLSANMADADFVHTLSANDLRMDRVRSEQISHLLRTLDQADEATVIRSAAEIDQVIKEVGR